MPLEVDGLTLATVEEIRAQLGGDVTAAMLRMWVRRHGLRRVRTGRQVWYDMHEAIEIDYRVRASGRGRPRHAGPSA